MKKETKRQREKTTYTAEDKFNIAQRNYWKIERKIELAEAEFRAAKQKFRSTKNPGNETIAKFEKAEKDFNALIKRLNKVLQNYKLSIKNYKKKIKKLRASERRNRSAQGHSKQNKEAGGIEKKGNSTAKADSSIAPRRKTTKQEEKSTEKNLVSISNNESDMNSYIYIGWRRNRYTAEENIKIARRQYWQMDKKIISAAEDFWAREWEFEEIENPDEETVREFEKAKENYVALVEVLIKRQRIFKKIIRECKKEIKER